ncbi:hypothetical protein JG688_00013698 [Phytophthora aleatoria]|uniref:Uncharacterized protein n=1 Tax=Phytophthora aleatoria TaxID=2496075 RepID=A0A8J5J1E1_9STRA|nr:hypothetical protein JG688_00013698 [Phytophthora aleatoria]
MATLNVKYQHRLQGPPSSHASTHIYDGLFFCWISCGTRTCGFDISQVLRFKKLVRIGGGCCEPELEQYRERDVAFSDVSVRQVLHRIESYQGQRDEWIKSSKSTPMLTNKDFAALFDGTKHYETPKKCCISGYPGLALSLRARVPPSLFCVFLLLPRAFLQVLAWLPRWRRSQAAVLRDSLPTSAKTQECMRNRFTPQITGVVCVAQGEPSGIALDEPPRNSCERHPLRWGLDRSCGAQYILLLDTYRAPAYRDTARLVTRLLLLGSIARLTTLRWRPCQLLVPMRALISYKKRKTVSWEACGWYELLR